MNTKALRQKILDLAIHGKLVPQDPNDEPASVLLERIKAEKERLIKEGKIKRTKRSKAACDKPHYPYELPEGWCWTTLGEIVKITNGRSQKDVEDKEGLYPIYGSGGIIGKATEFLCEAGTTIIGRKGTINNPIFVEERFWNIDTAFGMKPQYAISDKFFFFFCQHFDFSKLDKSTAVPSLTQSAINEIFIPIPPTNEQKRIVKEIIRCFSVVEILEKEKVDLQLTIEQAKSKILALAIHGKLVPQDPCDEPATELLKRINPKAEITCDTPQYENLPNGWCRCTLKDIGIFESGYAFSSDEYKQNGVPLVRISNITNNGNIDLSSCVYIQNYNNSKFIIHKGDLLIAMSGATTGKMGVYKYKADALLNQRVGNLKCTEAWLQQYRNYFMLAKSNYILNIAYGGAQPNISAKAILSIKIDLPPINEQHRIVAKIEELFTQLDNITSSI